MLLGGLPVIAFERSSSTGPKTLPLTRNRRHFHGGEGPIEARVERSEHSGVRLLVLDRSRAGSKRRYPYDIQDGIDARDSSRSRAASCSPRVV